ADGQGTELTLQLVTVGLPGQSLPLAGGGQAVDLLAEPGQLQFAAQGEQNLGDLLLRLAGRVGGSYHPEQGVQMYRTGCLAGDGGGSSGRGEVIESLLPQRPYRAFQHAVEAGVQCPDSGCEMLGFDGGLQLRPPATQEPARGAPG